MTSRCAVSLVLWLLFSFKGIYCLKNVELKSLEAVKAGNSLLLECNYDLEKAPLYSIKWYFGEHEFYRFVPKESPPTRVFLVPGITVDLSKSNDRTVALSNVQKELTGYYKCEVSADAPLFHTDIKSALVYVAEYPKAGPILMTDKTKYSVGEHIGANCTSHSGYPAANITWYINGNRAKNIRGIKIVTNVTKEASGLETVKSRIQVPVSSQYFHTGRLRIRCEARQFDLYIRSTESVLETDRPQLAHVLGPTLDISNEASSKTPLKTMFIFLVFIFKT